MSLFFDKETFDAYTYKEKEKCLYVSFYVYII